MKAIPVGRSILLLSVAFGLVACAHPKAVVGTAADVSEAPVPLSDGVSPSFADVPNASDVDDAQNYEALVSKVAAVTVYSDRARVSREAQVSVRTEPQLFAFAHLPGWVDDGSVRVQTTAGRIVDVRVERQFLANSTDENWKRVEQAHRALSRKIEALKDELAVLEAQKAQIESIKTFSVEKINQEALLGDVSIATYGDVVQFISESLRQTAAERRAVERELLLLTPEFAASERRMADLENQQQLEETTVLVTLQSSRVTSANLSLTYMLPGVTWEPMHELRVSTGDDKTVEVLSFAVVTQTSGEDWGDAQLSFSTQSSVASVRIPELEALTLGDTHTAKHIVTRKNASFTRAQQAFEGQSQLWNKLHQKSRIHKERINFEKTFQSNLEYLQVVQSKTVEIFESLQKRGTTEHFKAMATPSVRGDGHPVRMRIGHSVLTSSQKIVAAPEQSLNAALTLQLKNETEQSFLPGKVALYQDGSFLGMTDMAFIAQGETFSLFLSVADHLKISRKLDKKQSTFVRKKRNRLKVAFIVAVENLSDKPTSLTLADRIPVSENKSIRIESVKISPTVKPDTRGILFWDVTLKPGEVRAFKIAYQVEYPPELVLETRRKRAYRKANSLNRHAASPLDDYSISAPNAIGEQLLDLEEAF